MNTFYQRPLYLRLASTVTTIITSPTCEARLLRKSLTSRDYWASTNLISFVFKTSTKLVSAMNTGGRTIAVNLFDFNSPETLSYLP